MEAYVLHSEASKYLITNVVYPIIPNNNSVAAITKSFYITRLHTAST